MSSSTSVRPDEALDLDYEGLPPNASLAANLLAGAAAGIGEHAVMFPIDSIKTRMQVISTSPTHAIYSGMGNAYSRIATTEGAMSLWRGVTSVILGAGPAHAVYFGTYEIMKDTFGGNERGHQFLATASAGACATIASDALMNPFDVMKQRMQMQDSTYRSVVHAARNIYRNEGLVAFYISYPTTLTMTIPFTAVQFSSYEYFRAILNPSGRYSPLTHITAGGLAGGIAAACTTPLDVVKTLLQTRGTSTDAEIRRCSGLVEASRIIWRRYGIAGFFRGLTPRVTTFIPSNGVCWLLYEFAKKVIMNTETETAK